MRAFAFTSIASAAAIALLGAALAVGCGGDDTNPGNPTGDGGTTDTGTDSAPPPPPDAGDGGTDNEFSTFVIGLINTQTSPTTSPTTVDGKQFTDKHDPRAFDSLFDQFK